MTDDELEEWLQQHARPGDVLLSGARDPISAVIQRTLRSPYSHSMVVVDRDAFAHAYDHKFVLTDAREGIYVEPMRKMIGAPKSRARLKLSPGPVELSAVALLRPTEGVVGPALRRAVADFRDKPVRFSTGGCCLLWFIMKAETALRAPIEQSSTLPKAATSRVLRGLDVVEDRALLMLGDPGRATCSEFVSRTLLAAGYELRFDRPRLSEPMSRLKVDPGVDQKGPRFALQPSSVDVSVSHSERLPYASELPGYKERTAKFVPDSESVRDHIAGLRRRAEGKSRATHVELVTPPDFLDSPDFTLVASASRPVLRNGFSFVQHGT